MQTPWQHLYINFTVNTLIILALKDAEAILKQVFKAITLTQTQLRYP